MVSELRSLGAGAPAPVVEPKFGLVRVSDMENLPYCLLRVRSRWRSRDRLALWPAEVEVQPPEPKIRSPSRPPLDALQIGRAQSELQSLMRISYAVFCLKQNKHNN